MKNSKVLLALLLIIPVAFSCGKKPAAGKTVDSVAVDTTVYRVKVISLDKQKVSQDIDFTANLLPNEEINYAPASPGRVEEIYVEVGDHVKKGDLIARMDRTQLQQASEQYENARTNFQRMDTLHKLNSISQQQYDAIKTQYEVAKSSYDFMSKNTTLVSPINGIVTGKYFENGELYSGAPNTTAGKAAIVTLMQINPLKVMVNVSERYYPVARKGMKSTVTLDIFPGRTFSGEISQIYPTISPETRTFPVEILIKNNDEVLRPGMFARVNLNLGQADALILPANAVDKQEGTNDRYVYLAMPDNTAKKIRVELGRRYDDKLEVISNEIKVGDPVIVAGQDKLLDRSKITIVQ
jgi:membrane fusion protein, multidrug efflux system